MIDYDQHIRDHLIQRGLQPSEAESILGFVKQIETGVRGIAPDYLNSEPEFSFTAVPIQGDGEVDHDA